MNVELCTELDSHTHMPVVGKHAYIFAETGKKVDVSPFTPDYKPLMIPLVDATVRYNNPYNGLLPVDGQQPYPTIHAKGNGGNSEWHSKDTQGRPNCG